MRNDGLGPQMKEGAQNDDWADDEKEEGPCFGLIIHHSSFRIP